MSEAKSWVLLAKTNESIQAELLRGLLEAQGIRVLLAKEGAAKAIGLEMGALGEVEVRTASAEIGSRSVR